MDNLITELRRKSEEAKYHEEYMRARDRTVEAHIFLGMRVAYEKLRKEITNAPNAEYFPAADTERLTPERLATIVADAFSAEGAELPIDGNLPREPGRTLLGPSSSGSRCP